MTESRQSLRSMEERTQPTLSIKNTKIRQQDVLEEVGMMLRRSSTQTPDHLWIILPGVARP